MALGTVGDNERWALSGSGWQWVAPRVEYWDYWGHWVTLGGSRKQ